MVNDDDDVIGYTLHIVGDELRRAGLCFPVEMAKRVDRRVRDVFGGCEPYIARGRSTFLAERNGKINQLWNEGQRNIGLLATRFGLSTKQISRIVRKT